MNNNYLNLREIQLSSLYILEQVALICDENELRYFLMYGTLIGAVRHSGFIPWDDDVDIMMPRQDYEKLKKILKRDNEVAENSLKYFDSESKLYPYMIARVCDTRYAIDVTNEKDYGGGTFVDIYPYDSMANNWFLREWMGMFAGIFSSMYFQSTRMRFTSKNTEKSIFVAKCILFHFSRMIGKDRIRTILNYISRFEKDESSKYVGCLCWMTSSYRRNILPRRWVKDVIKVDFEGRKFCVPLHHDDLLRHYYGDYLTVPKSNDQVPHHDYIAWKKNESKFNEPTK